MGTGLSITDWVFENSNSTSPVYCRPAWEDVTDFYKELEEDFSEFNFTIPFSSPENNMPVLKVNYNNKVIFHFVKNGDGKLWSMNFKKDCEYYMSFCEDICDNELQTVKMHDSVPSDYNYKNDYLVYAELRNLKQKIESAII